MSEPIDRTYRVGGPITDLCRACKVVRDHTVMAIEGGRPVRVVCDFCRSEHNYRGGDAPYRPAPPLPRPAPAPMPPRLAGPHNAHDDHSAPHAPATPSVHDARPAPDEPRPWAGRNAEPTHESHRPQEGATPVTTSPSELEEILRRVVREELGLTPTAPAAKWRGGQMVLRPGKPGLQEKVLPIDALFHKIVMVRNRLRTLEQQLNAADLPEDLKLRLQTYVTGSYGSLTSFNVLFADEADQFRGSGSDE